MDLFFIERKDGLIFNSVQCGGGKPRNDQLLRKEVAVSILGGNISDWTGRKTSYEPEYGKAVRLIESDGAGGYTVSQDRLFAVNGLSITLSRGWFKNCSIMGTDDFHTFSNSDAAQSIAVDVIQDDETGEVELQPYVWDHLADPPEIKNSPPEGVTVLIEDLIRGVLPAQF